MDRFVRRIVPLQLAVLVVLAPQAGGAVYRWCAIVVAATVLIMTGLALWRRSVWVNARVDATCWVLTAMAAFSLLQLVPLPFHLVNAVAPKIASLYVDAADLPQAATRYFIPLTADASLTAIEALKWASYAGVYVTILNWPRGAGHQFNKLVLAASGLTAIVCVLESVFRVHAIMGIHEPAATVASWLRGPFVNPGHTGIYCAALGTLSLGAAGELTARWRNWVRVLGVALLVLGSTALAAKTALAVVVGPAAFLFLRARAAGWKGTQGWPLAAAAAAVLVAVVVVVVGLPSPDQIRAMPDQYLALRRYSRIITWHEVARLIADNPWTGVGRGAFGLVFTSYDTVNTDAITWHAENVPLQMAAEWGIVPTLAFVGAVGAAFVHALKLAKRPFACSAAAVLVMFAVVNLVDFNLELLGMGLLAIFCLAVLARTETKSVRVRQGHAALLVPAACLLLAFIAVATAGRRSLASDAEAIRVLTANPVDRRTLDIVGSAAATRHPADFFIPQLVAAEHLRLGTSLGVPWLNQTLTLRPRSPEAHYLTGTALQRAGRSKQALLEYALSARYLNRLVRPVGDRILRVPSLRRAALSNADWAGQGDEGLLNHLASVLVQESMRRERFLLDERLLLLRPDAGLAVSAIERERALALEDAAFLERLDLAIFVKPDETAESYLLAAAEIRAKAGRLADAEDLLWRATANPAGAYRGAQRLIDLLLDAGRPEEALSRLGAMEQGKRVPAGEIEFLRGHVHERGGRLQAALDSYVLAAQYRPDDVDTLVATALVAHRAGRSDLALQYARRATEAGRADSTVHTRLAPLWEP